MGKRGVKPLPAIYKELNGNPGKREYPSEPQATGHLCAPEWLDGEALDKWNQLAPELAQQFGAAMADSDTLAAYCYAWAKFVELKDAETYLVTDKGNYVTNPEVTLRNKSLEQLRKFGSVLGLSPSDRVGLPGNAHLDRDPAAEFIA
jgi:P27 family predicted phage terminase small subunit